METAVIQESAFNLNVSDMSANAAQKSDGLFSPVRNSRQTEIELGLWFSGLDSFLNFRGHHFADESRTKSAQYDWTKEFRLTHSVLTLCAKLNFQLGKNLQPNGAENSSKISGEINLTEWRETAEVLKDSLIINETLLRAAPLKFGEWKSWSVLLSEKLKSAGAFQKLIEAAENDGEDFLPEVLKKLLEGKSFAEQADLHLVLPRFARILSWLSVIGKMLERDEPLKPVLLIFSRLHEQIHELITFINNRLLHLGNEESELFGTLDGAAYTASIELKKVYTQELTGLAGIRPTPSVYAKVETSYSLLNDSFQQTLISFARLLDPLIEPSTIFPDFNEKRDNSLILRRDLWEILKVVQQSEKNPEKNTLAILQHRLSAFANKSLHYVFYKDQETIERFIEEILITGDKKDLIPILHRFGAYLETLFGQVNMRAVLAEYPFDGQ